MTTVLHDVVGSLGGVTEACFLQPMDVIKTRLQLDKAGKYTGDQWHAPSPAVRCLALPQWASSAVCIHPKHVCSSNIGSHIAATLRVTLQTAANGSKMSTQRSLCC